MLETMKPILEAAKKGNYGVVAPNVMDERTIRAVLEAAEELNAPVIIDVYPTDSQDIYYLSTIAARLAASARIPVAVNLDHGTTYEVIVRAIAADYTSVMVDRSAKPFEENVQEVAEIVKIAHACGKSVEAELGHVGMAVNYQEEQDKGLTRVSEALEYVERTGVDCLAVAIGTSHGLYPKDVVPHIDFDRLHQLTAAVSVPLVLHGGSGTGDETIAKACHEGISKVNMASDAFKNGRIQALALAETHTDARQMLTDWYEGYKEMVKHYMQLTGSAQKA